jgi:hypothetical protein
VSTLQTLDLSPSSVDLIARATLAYVAKCRRNLQAAHELGYGPAAVARWRDKTAEALKVHRRIMQLKAEFDLEPDFTLQITVTPAVIHT